MMILLLDISLIGPLTISESRVLFAVSIILLSLLAKVCITHELEFESKNSMEPKRYPRVDSWLALAFSVRLLRQDNDDDSPQPSRAFWLLPGCNLTALPGERSDSIPDPTFYFHHDKTTNQPSIKNRMGLSHKHCIDVEWVSVLHSPVQTMSGDDYNTRTNKCICLSVEFRYSLLFNCDFVTVVNCPRP